MFVVPATPTGVPAATTMMSPLAWRSPPLSAVSQAKALISSSGADRGHLDRMDAPGQRQASCRSIARGHAEDRGRRPLAGCAQTARPRARVGDDGGDRQQVGRQPHAGADRVRNRRGGRGTGRIAHRPVIAAVVLRGPDDAVHHRHRFQRELARTPIPRTASPHRLRDRWPRPRRRLRRASASGPAIINSSICVATMLGLARLPAGADDPPLDRRHLLGRHLHAEIAARDHHRIRESRRWRRGARWRRASPASTSPRRARRRCARISSTSSGR